MSYIEREALLKHAISLNNPHELGENVVPVSDIEAAPAADVAPVAHGEWVEAKLNGMHLYPVGQKMCSVCGQIMPSRWETMPPFCYGCGAKMDKEAENERND